MGHLKIALNELVGMENIIQQLQYTIKSRQITGEIFPSVFISSPAGCGKTQLAESLAAELGARFADYEAGVFRSREEIIQTLKVEIEKAASQGQKLLLFLDEVHGFKSRSLQETLYYPMTDWQITTARGKIEFSPFTLVAATTMRHKLDPAFRNRFDIKLELTRYSEEDMALILTLHLWKRNIHYDLQAATLLAHHCLGVPRDGVKYLDSCLDIMISTGALRLEEQHIQEFIKIQGLDRIGLSAVHRKYLRLLADKTHPVAIHTLAGVLQLSEGTVKYEIEPILVEKGLLEINRGRLLTAEGMSHIKKTLTLA